MSTIDPSFPEVSFVEDPDTAILPSFGPFRLMVLTAELVSSVEYTLKSEMVPAKLEYTPARSDPICNGVDVPVAMNTTLVLEITEAPSRYTVVVPDALDPEEFAALVPPEYDTTTKCHDVSMAADEMTDVLPFDTSKSFDDVPGIKTLQELPMTPYENRALVVVPLVASLHQKEMARAELPVTAVIKTDAARLDEPSKLSALPYKLSIVVTGVPTELSVYDSRSSVPRVLPCNE